MLFKGIPQHELPVMGDWGLSRRVPSALKEEIRFESATPEWDSKEGRIIVPRRNSPPLKLSTVAQRRNPSGTGNLPTCYQHRFFAKESDLENRQSPILPQS
jgi:hypothetical protein